MSQRPTRRDADGRACFRPIRNGIERLEGRRMLAAHIAGSPVVYATIQAAVTAATAGATVTVDAGTYAEQVTITRSLTIRGAKAGIDATGRAATSAGGESIVTGAVFGGVHSCAFYVNANDVTIDGFTVQGETDGSDATGAGIVIAPERSGTHVINDIVQHNVAGLFLANASATDAAVIQHDYFAYNNAGGNSGRGIYTDETISGGDLTNVTIDSDTFVANYGTDGLEAACAFQAAGTGVQSNVRVTNNVMAGNGKGTLFFDATGVTITGNTITGCVDGGSGALRFEGNDHTVTILDNTVTGNAAPAVAIDAKGVVGDDSGFVINDDNFYGDNTAGSRALAVVYAADVYDGPLDVRYNWWGSSTGPSGDGRGAGDAVTAASLNAGPAEGWSVRPGGTELFSPWLTARYAPSPTTATTMTSLSTLPWTSATIGYGSIGIDQSVGGNTLKLRGASYAEGIGTHAVSQIVYALNGKYGSFAADVGVDDEEDGKGVGSVDFKVLGDGTVLFDSGVVTNASPVVHVDANVTGVKQLTLLATNGVAGSIDYDHADWAGAVLTSATTKSANTATTAARFVLTPVTPSISAGSTASLTLAVLDANGNVATGYAGVVHFTSTDAVAMLPADYTFTTADAGVHTFRLTFKTKGSQRVVVADKVTSSLLASGGVSVQ